MSPRASAFVIHTLLFRCSLRLDVDLDFSKLLRESMKSLQYLFYTTENWGPMKHPAVDITWIQVESFQQRERKGRWKQLLIISSKKCFVLNTSDGVISRLISESRRPKNLRWKTMTLSPRERMHIHQSALCYRDRFDWRQQFSVESAKHNQVFCSVISCLQENIDNCNSAHPLLFYFPKQLIVWANPRPL